MALKNLRHQKAWVTPGTNHQPQQIQGVQAILCGSQTGNTPGTMGHRINPVCDPCSRLKQLPGTATGPGFTGCSRCSRCDPAKQQGQHCILPQSKDQSPGLLGVGRLSGSKNEVIYD